MVEVGTGFGVGARYLAAAMRATGGRYVGTEILLHKASEARRNLEAAGLRAFGTVLNGDALTSLPTEAGLDGIDMLVLDAWPPVALPAFRLLQPALPPGAMLVVDNVRIFRADLAPLLATLDPDGWSAVTLAGGEGMLIAVRGGRPP